MTGMFGFFKKRFVGVNYRALKNAKYPITSGGHAYVFKWSLSEPPQVGMWVYVPGSSGDATAVVVDTSATPQPGHPPKKVSGIVPASVVEDARKS